MRPEITISFTDWCYLPVFQPWLAFSHGRELWMPDFIFFLLKALPATWTTHVNLDHPVRGPSVPEALSICVRPCCGLEVALAILSPATGAWDLWPWLPACRALTHPCVSFVHPGWQVPRRFLFCFLSKCPAQLSTQELSLLLSLPVVVVVVVGLESWLSS